MKNNKKLAIRLIFYFTGLENGRMIGIINVSNIIGYAVSLMEEPA